MTSIETFLLIIIALILLPTLCKRINRPSLLYSLYLLSGLLFGSILESKAHFMIEEIGKVGFLLLLFLVGLEIDTSSFRLFKKSLPFCLVWLLVQLPLVSFGCYFAGYSLQSGFIAAVGINACSLGIAYSLLNKQNEKIDPNSIKLILMGMVTLEIISLIFFATSDIACKHGWGKEVLIHVLILTAFILMICLLSRVIHRYLSKIADSTGKWKIHQILLVVFSFAIIGERLGLSAPKTAFFLGLFMKAVTDQGIKFENELKPIAQDILIPIFFISLGSKISLNGLLPLILPSAAAVVVFLLAIRYLIFRFFSNIDLPPIAVLLYCPNLTMVAVASEILLRNGASQGLVDFTLATGLLMTLAASSLFHAVEKKVNRASLQVN